MTASWELPQLESCEELLSEAGELYMRQVHPRYWDGREVSPQAFDPSTGDDGKVSGARSGKQSAKGAYDERQAAKPGSTAGTWAVTVTEVAHEKSRVVDDSKCPAPPEGRPTGHCYLDQRMPDRPHRRKLRINLARAANRRGRLHPPVDTT